MKARFLTIAAIAAIMGFTACNKEHEVDNGLFKEEGKATAMKVSINFPRGAQARSTADPNGTDEESKISTVDVFIYTGSGNFSSHAHLLASDFTQGASTGSADVYEYTASAKIPTSTGAKNVFVGINLPSHVVDAVKGQSASALSSAVQTMSRSQLASNNNFVMFSTGPANSVFVEDDSDPANKVTVQCQRLVAKVTVETSPTMIQAGTPGIMGKLEFAINNFNTKLFLLQGAASAYKDPNWLSNSYVSGHFSFAVEADYAPILIGAANPSPAIADYTPRYAAENTSEEKRLKEITRATIRTTFIPRYITVGTTGAFSVDDAHGVVTPQTFYAVTPALMEGTSYFFNQSIANAFAAEKGGSVVTYTGGYCYWDIFLNKNPLNLVNRWDVLRNDFYKCNITRIVLPGRETPEIIDPELPPDVETNITTNIDILFWNTPIVSDYNLE